MIQRVLRVPPPQSITVQPVWIGQNEAQAITGKSAATVRRWIRTGRISCPASLKLLQVRLYGVILQDGWQGWRLVQGGIIGPDGRTVRPADLEANWVAHQLVGALRRRCDDLERQLREARSGQRKQRRGRLRFSLVD